MSHHACRGRWGLLAAVVLLSASELLSGEPAYHPRLLQKTSVDAQEIPLVTLLEELSAKHKVEIRLHESIAEAGQTESPVTLKVEGITLQSALKLICESRSAVVTFRVDNGVVTLMAVSGVEMLSDVDYPLTGFGVLLADPEQLDLVLHNCTSGPWEETDGIGGKILALTPKAMRIRQYRNVHEEIAELLADLRAVISGRKRPASPIDNANDRLRAALLRPVAAPAGELPLKDAIHRLLGDARLPCVLQMSAIAEEGIDLERPVTLTAGRKRLQEHLASILEPAALAFHVENEVVKVTTKQRLEKSHVIRVFDVRKRTSATTSPSDIAARIQQTPGLGPWWEVDGIGGIIEPIGPLLVIRHHRPAQDSIAQLLDVR